MAHMVVSMIAAEIPPRRRREVSSIYLKELGEAGACIREGKACKDEVTTSLMMDPVDLE